MEAGGDPVNKAAADKEPHSDHGPDANYRLAEPAGWAQKVAKWDAHLPEDFGDLVLLSGDCPRCTHRMEVELPIETRMGVNLNRTVRRPPTKPFAKTASCNCRGDHDGRPTDVLGCGAFGRLEVAVPGPSDVKVEGKEYEATLSDLEWERKAERLEADELVTVRATGEKWVATVSSITGVFSVVALIKGPEDISKLPGIWEASAIVLVLGAVMLALSAIVVAAFAAYGMPRRLRRLGGPLRREQAREARLARRLLAASVGLAVAAVLTLAVAIAITWAKSPEPAASGRAPTHRVLAISAESG
jgi:hypothetical protein